MIANEMATEEINMVSRMLTYHLENGGTIHTAFDTLRRDLPDNYENSISALEKMVIGDESVQMVGYGYSFLGLLNEFVSLIKQEKGDIGQLFQSSQEVLRDAVTKARDYWSGFNALITYFAIILMIAIGVSAVFTIFVLPQFQGMFESFGAPLPMFTAMVLNNNLLFTLIIPVLTLLVVICALCSYHIRVRVSQFRPLSNICRWVPGLNKMSDAYRYYLFVQYANILRKSDISDESAIKHAELMSGGNTNEQKFSIWRTAIETAGQMNMLIPELEYQSVQVGALFGRHMIVVRERLTLWVQVILGLLVGTLIIAMYLPIFKMGEVV